MNSGSGVMKRKEKFLFPPKSHFMRNREREYKRFLRKDSRNSLNLQYRNIEKSEVSSRNKLWFGLIHTMQFDVDTKMYLYLFLHEKNHVLETPLKRHIPLRSPHRLLSFLNEHHSSLIWSLVYQQSLPRHFLRKFCLTCKSISWKVIIFS